MMVACPGRLNDFLEGRQVRVDSVEKLVLDEVGPRDPWSKKVH